MVPLSAVEFRRVLPDLQLETEYHVAIRALIINRTPVG